MFGKTKEKDKIIADQRKALDLLTKQLSFVKKFESMLEENIPKEKNKRIAYMGDVALFYQKIFKNKIAHFITLQKDMLAVIGLTEAEYSLYRSNINCFHLIDDWMRKCDIEYSSEMEIKSRMASGESENIDFINNIKVI